MLDTGGIPDKITSYGGECGFPVFRAMYFYSQDKEYPDGVSNLD